MISISGYCTFFCFNQRLVLVPGFEPGSTDREPVMMDHYTIPAICFTRVHVYMSSAIYSESENIKIVTFRFYYMFTFSLLSISLVHMLAVDVQP